jgi:hypothetical protein
MFGLRRHRLPSGHSTCAAGPQNLSAAVRGMRWPGTNTKGGQLGRPYQIAVAVRHANIQISVSGSSILTGRRLEQVGVLRHSRINETVSDKRRLSDMRRQPKVGHRRQLSLQL